MIIMATFGAESTMARQLVMRTWISCRQRSVRSQSYVEQLRLTCDDHPSLSGELEVGSSSSCVDYANELA